MGVDIDRETQVVHGDCLEVMPALPAESVAAIVTDPPYGLGFMGKAWDHGVPGVPFWKEALRVAKPGAHLLAFGGTRTYHRMVCALEDAGWEIRDCLMWLHAQGFPKSHDVSKAIDKQAGATRKVVGPPTPGGKGQGAVYGEITRPPATAPATAPAEEWEGWGTALKPAYEPVVLARKPMPGTVAANVQAHGAGALNIDGCRIGTDQCGWGGGPNPNSFGGFNGPPGPPGPPGRWPAHIVLSHHEDCDLNGACSPECPCRMLDEQSDCHGAGAARAGSSTPRPVNCDPTSWEIPHGTGDMHRFGDFGGASRFYFCAKPARSEREAGLSGMAKVSGGAVTGRQPGSAGAEASAYAGTTEAERANIHPTVKPVDLMRWLVRLVTPLGGLVLDPFTGSGTTGIAAHLEGCRFIGIEKEAQYVDIARARIKAEADQPLLPFGAP